MNIEKHKEQIIKKIEEIDHKNGLILIESIIDNNYNKNLIKDIISSLSKNNNKYIYQIYDYIIKNTEINFDTYININENYCFLHLCAEYGNINLLNYLIKNGADINLQDKYEWTALMFSSKYSNDTSSIETVKLLLENGADINLQNNYGYTALMLASISSVGKSNDSLTIETIKLLLDYGADINLKNNEGFTALMISSENSFFFSSTETVKLLLENGTDTNLQDILGKTAYDLASTNECRNLIESYMN